MVEIRSKQDCCGCRACYNICPHNAISMREDEEGFIYPIIDKEKCVHCGLCQKICPVINAKSNENHSKIETIAAYTKNVKARMCSSSGGIFFELAQKILETKGVVIGAGYDENFNVIHKIIFHKEDLEELQGSKYVQSDTKDTYKETKKLLEDGKRVLYVGTPCQIAGLKAYLKRDYEELYTCDLVCHGVPSPKVWEKYLDENKKKEKIKECYFRNKDKGWNVFSLKIIYENDKYDRKTLDKDKFLQLFLRNYSLRPSCYHCQFSKFPRVADISLGDFWRVENKYTEFKDDKGTSLILINSEKGKQMFNWIKDNLYYRQDCDLEYAIKCNPCICGSVNEPIEREQFFKDLDSMTFEELSKKYLPKEKLYSKIYRKITMILSALKKRIKI